jgi:hypothetical protein
MTMDNNPKRLADEIIKWLEKSSHVSTYSFYSFAIEHNVVIILS